VSKVEILEARCKACGLCIVFCPHDALQFADHTNDRGFHPAVQPDAGKCRGCASCALMCPEAAIIVYRSVKRTDAAPMRRG
jgi:2-oxoglutarate ferredoxin oxidoreductase subunit delta